MPITRTLPAAFALAGAAATGLAATAQADPDLLNGTYTVEAANASIWVITSTCANEGCTANISSSSGWSGVATLSNGQWSVTVDRPVGVICDDGTTFPSRNEYSFNAVTLTGKARSPNNGECGSPGRDFATRLILTKIG